VQSILVHSDTVGALDLARGLRRAIAAKGGTITPLSRQGLKGASHSN
jgi:lactam utilization protein B